MERQKNIFVYTKTHCFRAKLKGLFFLMFPKMVGFPPNQPFLNRVVALFSPSILGYIPQFLGFHPYTGWWFQICFMFTPIWGRWSHFDEHIFQRGWFNHQPVYIFNQSANNRSPFSETPIGRTSVASPARVFRRRQSSTKRPELTELQTVVPRLASGWRDDVSSKGPKKVKKLFKSTQPCCFLCWQPSWWWE